MPGRLASLLSLGAVLSAVLVWLVAAPVVSAGDPCYHDFDLPKATTSSATTVTLEPCAFTPTLTDVPIGATVTFTNPGPFAHLITGANQGWGSRDTEVLPGKDVRYTFDEAGVYPYACALHRGMSGAIVVGGAEALTAAAAGTTSGTTTTVDPLVLVLTAVAAGLLIGGMGGWLVSRRRTTTETTTVTRAA